MIITDDDLADVVLVVVAIVMVIVSGAAPIAAGWAVDGVMRALFWRA